MSTSRKPDADPVTETALEFIGGIELFDATERRKQRMRNQAARPANVPPAESPDRVVAAPLPAPTPEPAPTAAPVKTTATPASGASSNGSAAAKAAPDRAGLATFLINFVVEQTGYPLEIVEMDADLEADLGIDGIKKAQLFGELREYFDITPDENLSLDDFPTLRHVQDYLVAASGATSTPAAGNGAAAQPPSSAAPPPIPTAVATPTPASTPTAAGPNPAERDSTELDSFLVNFVVEQTGYPPEIVEMDADLEADLGIDSIKKAQLFGELREYFDITPDENLSLDDFPTLRHVKQFLLGAQPVSEVSSPDPVLAASAVVPQAVVEGNGSASVVTTVEKTQTRSSAELATFLVNFVVEQTGYPPEIVEMDVDLEADLGIDSIKKAQLFGELREYFDIIPDENLSLDDFPTLQHIAEYLKDK